MSPEKRASALVCPQQPMWVMTREHGTDVFSESGDSFAVGTRPGHLNGRDGNTFLELIAPTPPHPRKHEYKPAAQAYTNPQHKGITPIACPCVLVLPRCPFRIGKSSAVRLPHSSLMMESSASHGCFVRRPSDVSHRVSSRFEPFRSGAKTAVILRSRATARVVHCLYWDSRISS